MRRNVVFIATFFLLIPILFAQVKDKNISLSVTPSDCFKNVFLAEMYELNELFSFNYGGVIQSAMIMNNNKLMLSSQEVGITKSAENIYSDSLRLFVDFLINDINDIQIKDDKFVVIILNENKLVNSTISVFVNEIKEENKSLFKKYFQESISVISKDLTKYNYSKSFIVFGSRDLNSAEAFRNCLLSTKNNLNKK